MFRFNLFIFYTQILFVKSPSAQLALKGKVGPYAEKII